MTETHWGASAETAMVVHHLVDSANPSEPIMTPAHMREPQGADYVEVVFHESARFYRLPESNPRFKEILARLRSAIKSSQPVTVRLTKPHGDTIADVQLSRP